FRRKILDGGPLTILRVPLILQQWHPALRLVKDQHQLLPVWVKLRHIPHALWSASGISAVASVIGKPLHVDIQTEKMRMISYARVCIEVKATQSLLDSVDVIWNDETWSIKVNYEWRPVSCLACGTFGHGCTPPSEVHAVTQKLTTQVAAAADAPPSGEDIWETIGKRNTRTPVLASSSAIELGAAHMPTPALASSSLAPKIMAASAVIQYLPDPGLISRASPEDSSDSDTPEVELVSNIGSDPEELSRSPAPTTARLRSSVHQGCKPQTECPDTSPPAPVMAQPTPGNSPVTTKVPLPKSRKRGGTKSTKRR
ncbi:uncharacterized protein LOC130135975, partial [Syzygium oleosum]|uniref:uncharacterized protein LOC130135975 n=1 Tax=Syzygium oleosum TaxID=219896 RepID=UPI0024B90EDB